jgi:hypothetical protein
VPENKKPARAGVIFLVKEWLMTDQYLPRLGWLLATKLERRMIS